MRKQPQIDPDKRVKHMVQRLKDSSHRITPQRFAICKMLATSKNHPSAEDIYTELIETYPTMSLATVYKTLKLLKQEKEVLELAFSDLGNRYDGNMPYPHPHALCTNCGIIIDLSNIDLEEITNKMAQETGFKITMHRLDFCGLCADCQIIS